MYFVPIKQSKFSNFYIINISAFYKVIVQKQKFLNFGPNMTYLCIFGLEF